MLILSQYVEQLYARELMSDRAGAVGYLLKDGAAGLHGAGNHLVTGRRRRRNSPVRRGAPALCGSTAR
ncbi:hypothetical protein Airi02_102380 [Actinoallomurus iriomotensis]|uniref:Uncharacterized protein n=1 Tax=Actinoallomurus iriomotensis TaxID=478107 RepID=A0A9W6SCJ0_9ACTN|nr:hypothetical protein Airi02_102380 [Actinoallomurus iriomotensis]